MNSILSNKAWCFGIAVLFLMAQLLLIKDEVLYTFGPDAFSYFHASDQFWSKFNAYSTRPIGMSILLGIPWALCKDLPAAILTVTAMNLVFWCLSMNLIYKVLLTRTNSPKVAGLGVLLFSFHVSIAIHMYLVLSEPLFILLLLLLIRYLQLFFRFRNAKYLNLSFAVVLLMILVKPVAIYIAVIMSFFWLFQVRKLFKRDWSFWVLILAVLGIFLQLVLMKKTFGEYKISYVDNITWYYYLGAQAEALRLNSQYSEIREIRRQDLDVGAWENKVPAARADLTNQLKNNKNNIFSAYLSNLRSNFFTGNPILKKSIHDSNNPKEVVKWFHRLSKWQNIGYNGLLFSLCVGFVYLVIRKKAKLLKKMDIIILLISGYIFTTSGITFTQGDRLTLIAQPLLLILVLTSCILLQKNLKNKEHAI